MKKVKRVDLKGGDGLVGLLNDFMGTFSCVFVIE